jgi:hypothetical protein
MISGTAAHYLTMALTSLHRPQCQWMANPTAQTQRQVIENIIKVAWQARTERALQITWNA